VRGVAYRALLLGQHGVSILVLRYPRYVLMTSGAKCVATCLEELRVVGVVGIVTVLAGHQFVPGVQVRRIEPIHDRGVAVHADVSTGELQKCVEDGTVRIMAFHTGPLGEGGVDGLLIPSPIVTPQAEGFRSFQKQIGIAGAMGRVALHTAAIVVNRFVNGFLG